MTAEEVQVGRLVRVSMDRWDVPAGTLGRVLAIGTTGNQWCFTVEWLARNSPVRRRYSLNLFEADLPDFEAYDGPVSSPPSFMKSRRSVPKERPLQLALPFAGEGWIGPV